MFKFISFLFRGIGRGRIGGRINTKKYIEKHINHLIKDVWPGKAVICVKASLDSEDLSLFKL